MQYFIIREGENVPCVTLDEHDMWIIKGALGHKMWHTTIGSSSYDHLQNIYNAIDKVV